MWRAAAEDDRERGGGVEAALRGTHLIAIAPRRGESTQGGSHGEWGYIGRKFASKLWAPNSPAAVGIAAHLKSLMEFPPSQSADTLSLKKALEEAERKMMQPHGSSN